MSQRDEEREPDREPPSEPWERRDPPPPSTDPRLEIPEVLRRPATPPPEPKDTGLDRRALTQTAEAWGVALDFVITIVAGALLGWLFDRWRATGPWGTLVGLALGFVTSFIRIIRYTQRSEARERAARSRQREGDGDRREIH